MKYENPLASGRAVAGAVLLLGLAGWSLGAQAAPTLSAGCSAGFVGKAAVKFSNFSNGAGGAAEINVGPASLAGATAGDLTWAGGKAIEFSFDTPS